MDLAIFVLTLVEHEMRIFFCGIFTLCNEQNTSHFIYCRKVILLDGGTKAEMVLDMTKIVHRKYEIKSYQIEIYYLTNIFIYTSENYFN